MAGWVAYHERRWGLDHVDVFVQEGDFEKSVQDHLEEVPVEFEARVNVTALPNTGQPYEHQIWLMNQCLENAKEADFMFNFDADEYLVSDDYETLSELFEFTNRPGVSFPIFPNNYHQCSAHAPTYGSATYQSIVPLGAEPDGQGSYTNPPPGVLAHRKYVVRPQRFQELESVHDPFGLYARPQGFEGLEHGGNDEDMYYMTGKSEMGHHARVVHMRTDVGIQADDTEILCQITPACTYVTQDAKCIKNVNQAMYVNKKTSLNEILADLPLTKEAMNLFRESVCYAKRYPNLYSGFCGDDDSACHYEGLSKHYQETGKPSNMIWGCMERPTTFATPVVPSILEKFQMSFLRASPKKLHFILFETDHSKEQSEILAWQQSTGLGIQTSIVGIGEAFVGFASKWVAVRSALEELGDDSLVVIGDSRDMLLNVRGNQDDERALVDDFIKAYQTLTSNNPDAVVFSAEGQCCVAALLHAKPGDYFDDAGNRRQRACNSGEEDCLWLGDALKLPWESFQQDLCYERTGAQLEDVYLNAGLVAGRPSDLLRLVDTADLEPTEDDQAVFTDLMYHYPERIVLDYAQELFGTARWSRGMEGGCPFESEDGGPLVHQETLTTPLLLHFPGKFWECHDTVAHKLGIDTSNQRWRSLSGTNYRSTPEVIGFALIDATTNAIISAINNGDVIDLTEVGTSKLNIRALVSGLPGSVVLMLNANTPRTENVPPFALFGDNDGDYLPGKLPLGQNYVTATPYQGTEASGPVGIPLTVTFTVVKDNPTCKEGEYTCIDFSETPTGDKLNNGDYIRWEWHDAFGMEISADTTRDGYTPYGSARIYDTATINGEDPDLGSPNERCRGGGPGMGEGGEPDQPGENCIAQGNVVIIQESNKPEPDDNAFGGIIRVRFDPPVKEFLSVALLDIDGKTNSLQVFNKHKKVLDREIVSLGDNAFQVEEVNIKDVAKVNIVASRSFGISKICFCY